MSVGVRAEEAFGEVRMGTTGERTIVRAVARVASRCRRCSATLSLLAVATVLGSFLASVTPDSLSAAAATVPPGGAPPPGSGTKTSSPVVRVIDGMTIDTYINGQEVGIHLVGINAPQGNTACGRLATKLLQTLVKGGGLTLEEDPQTAFTPKSGGKGPNLRAYFARTKDGRPLTQELVKAGLAAVDDSEGQAAHHFDTDQAAAKNGRVGCVWGGSGPAGGAQSAPGGGRVVPDQDAAGSDLFRAALAAPQSAAQDAPLASVSVPANFVVQSVVTGLNTPTNFAWLPDGRMLVTEKPGTVRVVKNGTLLATPLIDLTGRVNDYWDHGLLGIAVDPNFATNGFIYLLYTYENDATQYNGPKTARLARYTVSGDTASPTSEQVILGTTVGAGCDQFAMGTDCLPSENPSHSIGTVRFGSDGTLWVTVGDGASFNVVDPDALRAQNLDSLAGKLLHITTGGQGVAGNPFSDGNAAHNRSKVWAYGFRNPFRFTFRPGSATPYIGDVGWSTWEEQNVGVAGGNYGWPCYEGQDQQAGYAPTTDPLQNNAPVCQNLYNQGAGAVRFGLATWGHVDNGVQVSSASVGGAFYTGTNFPAQYQGAYFYADYGRSDIRFVTVDASNNATGTPSIFATAADGPVSLQMSPTNDLYYAAINTGEIRKIVYGTQTATATATPNSGASPLAVQFSSAGTTDLYGGTLTYSWDFGDGGAASTAANPTHTYTGDGIYTATLTATNSHGEPATATAIVTVGTGGCPVGQYLAQYFGAKDLSGNILVARCEAAPLNDTIGTTPNWPPAGVSASGQNFSVRWAGQFGFGAGGYTFTATADDGIRVWLDNQLIIDHWVDQAPTTYTASVASVTTGNHAVKVEYYQGGGGGTAQVSWQATGQATTCPVGQYLAQYFANQTLTGTPVVSQCEAAPLNDTLGNTANWPPAGVGPNQFSVRWDGQFAFATAGSYTFTATADDGIRVYLDGQAVIDKWIDQAPTTYTYTAANLAAGNHDIKVEYYQGYGGATARVSWGATVAQPPTATIASPAATLTYKVGDTISYSGSATDPKDGTIPASGLSWAVIIHHCPSPTSCHTHYLLQNQVGASGSFTAPDHGGFDDSYLELQLTATNSSGLTNTASVSIHPIKVQVTLATSPTGLQVIAGGTTYTAPVTLQGIPGSSATIQVASPQGGQAFASWSDGGAQQHNITVPTTDTTYTATFTASATPDFTIAAAPSSQSVAQGGNTTYTVTVAPANGFTGTVALSVSGLPTGATSGFNPTTIAGSGTVTLTVTAGASTPTGSSPLTITGTSGTLSHTANATLVVTAAAPTSCPVGQYLAQYYANKTLSGAPAATRCEAAPLNDTLGGTANWPPTGVPTTNFSARWDGQFAFATAGAYTFTVTGDDGIRLYVDNQLVIDRFVDQGPTTYTYTAANLAAGNHAVKVEFYQAGGGATAQARWQASSPPPPPPMSCPKGQYLAQYYANKTLSGTPVVTQCEAAPLNDTLGSTANWPPAGVPTTNFSVRWSGQFDFTAGSHTFSITGDDGIRLFVDGSTTPLVNGWKDQAPTTYTASTTLTAGTHTVAVEFYQAGGGAVAKASWT
jgi:glucose/arabinose dehydrogenase/endonuclease YncB( thermonuclease family)